MAVPAGYRLDYELKDPKRSFPGQKPEKPLALVKVVPDSAPAPALHAELAHVTEATTKKSSRATTWSRESGSSRTWSRRR